MSLLELVIALSLIALLVGIGAISYASGGDERVMRQTAAQLESMSSRGHAMAVLHQKPFWLRLEEGKVLLVGADLDESHGMGVEEEDRHDFRNQREPQESREVVYDEYPLRTTLSLRRWGDASERWLRPEKSEFLTWQFQSTGLCEPVSLKIELGDNWIIMHMHPLTARVDEEEMYIE